MTVEFKIYGIFRSGTNLLKLLVEQNMDATCRVNVGGQKHLFTPVNWGDNGYIDDGPNILACVKDPYAAMVSLFRYAREVEFIHFECGRDWESFLAGRFVVKIGHPSKPPAFLFRTPVDYWNAHAFHMLTLREDRRMMIRYEELLNEPDAVLQRIAARFPGAPVLRQAGAVPGHRVKRMGERLTDDPLEKRSFDATWYRNRAYLDDYSGKQLALMKELLDPFVLETLAYHYA